MVAIVLRRLSERSISSFLIVSRIGIQESRVKMCLFSVEPISVADQVRSYLAHEVNPTLTVALAELCKTQPDDPVVRS